MEGWMDVKSIKILLTAIFFLIKYRNHSKTGHPNTVHI
jgi:hypothetical protein